MTQHCSCYTPVCIVIYKNAVTEIHSITLHSCSNSTATVFYKNTVHAQLYIVQLLSCTT